MCSAKYSKCAIG